MIRIWDGIDSGEPHHHCLVLDESDEAPLSRRVANDEPELLEVLDAVLALGNQVAWTVDIAGGKPALLLPCSSATTGKSSTFPPVRSIGPATATDVGASLMPAMCSSSLTRPASVAISTGRDRPCPPQSQLSCGP